MKSSRTKKVRDMIKSTNLSARSNGRRVTGNKRGQQETLFPVPDDQGSKQDRRAEEIADTGFKMSRSNPLSYYTKFTKFAEDAARLPFALPLGARIPLTMAGNVDETMTIPGVMRIVFTPTVGISDDFTSPINRSSTRFYTYLRSNQKASASYDHQDITMMELALDSAYMFHAMCSRVYGLAQNVSPVNEYYARTMIAAAGCIYSDLRQNLQNFRQWINTFAYNLGQFSLPSGITLFDRHRWMCEGYYLDGETNRAQSYIFVPRGFWKYDNTVETGSQLSFVEFLGGPGTVKQWTVSDLMAFGDSLLNAIAGDEDFQIISGDIYNFYGGDVYTVPYIGENYKVLPIFDKTVLSQIENLTIVGELSNNIITQNPDVNQGAIVYHPMPSATAWLTGKVPMNFHWNSPQPGEVIEATRLTAAMHRVVDAEGHNVATIDSCGTELVNRLDVFGINPTTGAPRNNHISTQQVMLQSTTTAAEYVGIVSDLINLAQFDWAPYVFLISYDTAGLDKQTPVGFSWDTEVFDFIPTSYLSTIHVACLYSLFEVGTNRVELD